MHLTKQRISQLKCETVIWNRNWEYEYTSLQWYPMKLNTLSSETSHYRRSCLWCMTIPIEMGIKTQFDMTTGISGVVLMFQSFQDCNFGLMEMFCSRFLFCMFNISPSLLLGQSANKPQNLCVLVWWNADGNLQFKMPQRYLYNRYNLHIWMKNQNPSIY